MQDPLEKIATLISETRKSASISIEDLATKSKVSIHHIENIENLNSSELPENTYLMGFIKKILKALDFNQKQISEYIDEFKKSEGESVLKELVNESYSNEFNSSIPWAKPEKATGKSSKMQFQLYHLYIALAVIVLGIAIFSFTQSSNYQTVIPEAQSPEVLAEVEDKKETKVISKPKAKVKKTTESHEPKVIEQKKKVTEQKKKEKKTENKDKKEDLKDQDSKEEDIEPKIFKNYSSLEPEMQNLRFKIQDIAWFQVIGIDSAKVIFEGDVFPNKNPSEFDLVDKVGFVLATGNAAAFKINGKTLGDKGEVTKKYFPSKAREIYLSRQRPQNTENN